MARYRHQPPRFTAADLIAAVEGGTTPALPVRMRASERAVVAVAMQHIMTTRDICAAPAGLLCGVRSASTARSIAVTERLTSSPAALASARAATLRAAGQMQAEAAARATAARSAASAARANALQPQAIALRQIGATQAEIAAALGVCRAVVRRIAGPRPPAQPKVKTQRPPRPPRAPRQAKPKATPRPSKVRTAAVRLVDSPPTQRAAPNPRLSPAQRANNEAQRGALGRAWRFDPRTARLAAAPPLTREQEDALIARALAARASSSTTLGEGTTT